MKKIWTCLSIAACTTLGYAQGSERFYDSEQDYKQQVEASDPGPAPGGDDPQPAPADAYVPLLFAAGLGLAAWYARRKPAQAS